VRNLPDFERQFRVCEKADPHDGILTKGNSLLPRSLIVLRRLVLAEILLAAPAFAQQPTFPLLQDGGARSAFVGGVYRTCIKEQRASTENVSLSTPELGAFCLCFGRALADAINGAEYEAIVSGRLPDSLGAKQLLSANVCVSRMRIDPQASQESQLKVAVENRCRKEFHPEDTDFAAAQVRERFCSCYSVAVSASGRGGKSPTDATDYCSQRMGPND
jgi:hypothetical protein